MDAVALKNQLSAHIAAMYAGGSVDQEFQQMQMIQEEDGGSPGFVAEIVNLFIDNAGNILGNIADLLEQPEVDFYKVDGLVHQLKGCSSGVGAGKVKLMCEQFRQYIDAKSREGCLMALTIVRNEFNDLRNKFQTMLQLEEQIEAYATKQ
ncbi:unnamed protein product [Alopecurus aequalis]